MITSGIVFPVYAQSSDPQDTGEYKDNVEIRGQVATDDFTWTPQNFAGFYYDLDADVGTEMLTATLSDGQLSGSYPFGLTYQTTAQEKRFRFKDWGSYSVIGFLGKKCLAGYLESTGPEENLFFQKSKDGNSLAKGQLEEVLLDDDMEMVVTASRPLMLKDGYKLELKALNATDGRIYVELAKDGQVVNSKMFQLKENAATSDATYYFNKDTEDQNGLVIIAIHFKNVFHGSDEDFATVDGIFQISDSPILVAKGTSFGKMTVSDITADQISMDNQDSPITVSKNKDVLLAWPSLHLRTADQSVVDDTSPLRYYPYLKIDSPDKYDIRGAVSTGDYTWTPQNFAGFYYDLDDDVGTETLTATLSDNKLAGDYPYGLVYETTAQKKPFRFQDWGSYHVMGFLGEKCFAEYIEGADSENGYLFEKSADNSALDKGQLLKILADDNTERTINSSATLKLEQGYELALKSINIDGNAAYLELIRNGVVEDARKIQPSKSAATMADKTYYYKNPQVGDQKNLVTIAVHFKNAFRGADQNIATIDGVWQISEAPIVVKAGIQYDRMTIRNADTANGVITMDNSENPIILSKNKDTLLMGGIYIQTADSDSLRYYIVKHEEIKDTSIDEMETGYKPVPSNENVVVPSKTTQPHVGESDGTNGAAVPAETLQVGTDQILVPVQESLIQTSDWGEVPPNQIIVVLKDGKGRSDANRLAASLGGQVVGSIGYINLYQIETSGKTEEELKSAIDKAQQDQDMVLAFPNQKTIDDMAVQGVQCSALDDPVYTEKGHGKGYEMIGVQRAWDLMRASGLSLSNVNVGVVDDGLYKGNDEYNGKTKIDTTTPHSELVNPNDQFGSHGTRVMNILAADSDNGGETGIASEPLKDKLTVSMVNRRAYGANAMGSLLAVNESVNKGAKIVSCSWGDTHANPNTVKAYKKFFEKMVRDHPDVLFVCSAGNDGEVVNGDTRYPSGLALPNMITVGNIMNDGTRAAGQKDEDGRVVSKSNMASANFEVTLAAPGEQAVKGFDSQGNLINNNGGTSMATPQVTAAASMISALNPKLDAGQIKEILTQSARTSVDIDGRKVPAPPELGGKILAIDQAVLEVINDLRAEKGLSPLRMEDAIASARVALVARNDSTSPQDWKVTAEILGIGTGGADVVIELQGEGAVGGDSKRHLSQSGNLAWDVTTKGSATVVVERLDTKGCSKILLPESAVTTQGLSGKWTIWTIIPGTDKKVAGVGGYSDFTYELSQSGSSVTLAGMAYRRSYRSLDIEGTISGNTFIGTFKNNDQKSSNYGKTEGSVEITFSPDGNHFTGTMIMENWESELEWGGDRVF